MCDHVCGCNMLFPVADWNNRDWSNRREKDKKERDKREKDWRESDRLLLVSVNVTVSNCLTVLVQLDQVLFIRLD